MARSKVGKHACAIEDLTQAQRIYEACQMKDTVDYAAVLINLSQAWLDTDGEKPEVRTNLETAKGIFESLGQMSDPRAALVVQMLSASDAGNVGDAKSSDCEKIGAVATIVPEIGGDDAGARIND